MGNLEVTKREVKDFKKLSIIEELTPLQECVKLFENKYDCSFEEFAKRISTGSKDFEQWDDYIEWKAYREKIKELQHRLGDIEDAKDIKFVE